MIISFTLILNLFCGSNVSAITKDLNLIQTQKDFDNVDNVIEELRKARARFSKIIDNTGAAWQEKLPNQKLEKAQKLYDHIRALEKYLNEKNYRVRPMMLNPFL